jgi:hypothetical protein
MFNPQLRVQTMRMSSGNPYYVVDEALLDPAAAVQYAVDHRALFTPSPPNGYPGITLAPSAPMGKAVLDFYADHMRRRFDARRLMHALCRYSMVTLPVEQLSPAQMLCHRDDPPISPQHSISAAVLYLFHDPVLGGTSFYEAARSLEETDRIFRDARQLSSGEFTARYGMPQGYMAGSNAFFTRVAEVEARWNRLVFYDGGLLHLGDIGAPERLSADPATGRLTLNFFFSSRRNLA